MPCMTSRRSRATGVVLFLLLVPGMQLLLWNMSIRSKSAGSKDIIRLGTTPVRVSDGPAVGEAGEAGEASTGEAQGMLVGRTGKEGVDESRHLEKRCLSLRKGVGDSVEEWERLRCRCVLEDKALSSLECFHTASSPLNGTQLRLLSSSSAAAESAMNHTQQILSFGTRVPGDPGWQQTMDYIVAHLTRFGWHVEKDSFQAATPLGPKQM
jgi:hypothetical protein